MTHLIILDCFDNILDAADTLHRLIDDTASSHWIVTSHLPLKIPGEQRLRVDFMSTTEAAPQASLAEIEQNESVELFVRCAREIDNRFKLTESNSARIGEICTELAGWPLALKLAAARPEIRTRIGHTSRIILDVLDFGEVTDPERQRTLRQAIAWSYDHLDGHSQTVLRRLSVFGQSFSKKAATYVCDLTSAGDTAFSPSTNRQAAPRPTSEQAPITANAVADTVHHALSVLEVRGLIREFVPGGERYALVPLVSEFGRGLLPAMGELAQAKSRHTEFFLKRAIDSKPVLYFGKQTASTISRLQYDFENFIMALEFALDNGQLDAVSAATSALTLFWEDQGHIDKSKRILEGALRPQSRAHTTEPEALAAVSRLAIAQGDYRSAVERLEKARAHYRSVNDVENLAYVSNLLGLAESGMKRHSIARECHEEANKLCADVDRPEWCRSFGEYGLAVTLLLQRDKDSLTAATHLLESSLTARRDNDDTRGVINTNVALGLAKYGLGEFRDAQRHYADALKMAVAYNGYPIGLASALDGLAFIAELEGDVNSAARLLGAAFNLREWHSLTVPTA